MESRPCKRLRTCDSQKISSSCDRDFGDLPDFVLESIASRLSIRDVAATRALSRSWNRICPPFKSLRFDCETMFPGARQLEAPCGEHKNKFAHGVTRFLEAYSKKIEKPPQLDSFEVSFCLDNTCSDHIDQWVRFAIRLNVEDLKIGLFCDKQCSSPCKVDFSVENSKHKYLVRRLLFSPNHDDHDVPVSGVNCLNLQKLTLFGCAIEPGLFISNQCQFQCLKSLVLNHVSASAKDENTMFSGLVNLQYLSLIRCRLPSSMITLYVMPALVDFTLYNCPGTTFIYVSSANVNLRHIHCISSQIVRCFYDYVPNLIGYTCTTGLFGLKAIDGIHRLLPKLKYLGVFSSCNWVRHSEEIRRVSRNIVKLTLSFKSDVGFCMGTLISLIKACPSLETFAVTTYCLSDIEEGKLGREPRLRNYAPKYLKEVEINGSFSTPMQIEFAVYILKKARSLQHLVLRKCRLLPGHERLKESWNISEREKIQKLLHKSFMKARVIIE